jgi:hypothetical protein
VTGVRHRHTFLRVASAVAACLILSSAPAAAIEGDDHSKPKRLREWDDRILPLVGEVERLRDLDFEHPVPVSFLSNRRFEKEFESDPDALTKAEREDLEDSTAALRALGLFEGNADELLDAANEVDAEGTLAFYDSEEERIVIRGRDLDVETGVTVAHELVHALQDQHFDLDKLSNRAGDATEGLALDALIEGDAVRIEEDYVTGLSSDAQNEYFAAYADTIAEIDEGFSEDIPEIIPVTFGIPYDLGPSLLHVLIENGGNERVDDAFDDPPVTDEHVLEPATYLDGDEPDDVPRIRLADSEKRVGERQPFGSIALYLMLASRIDTGVALEAAEGWGGDEVVQFTHDGETCVRARFVGETPDDTDQIAGALDQWVATLPPGAAQTERRDAVTLTSCDSREGLPPAPNSVADAEAVLYNRAFLADFLAEPPNPIEPPIARCAATTLALDPANKELVEAAELSDEELDTFFDRVDAAVAECG